MGGRWMNEYGAMVEWYWQGKTEVLWEKNFPAPFCLQEILHGLALCWRMGPCGERPVTRQLSHGKK